MKNYQFNSGKYERLELIIARTSSTMGEVALKPHDGHITSIFLKYDDYEHKSFDLRRDTDYTITFHNTHTSLAYLCGNDDILDAGICFIQFEDEDILMYDKHNMKDAYIQSYRNQFHFAPFRNWMNDPNGLCYYKGKYHMFYQHNPKSQGWGHMHWGHAISTDLLHWTHLPIVFFPQKELYNNQAFTGGAFSGSAIVDDYDNMHLFLTRSFSAGNLWTRQWQTKSSTDDGLSFSPEELVLEDTPEGVGMDFRDPMIYRIKDSWYMFIAAAHNEIPAILLYSSKDLAKWEYEGPILKESDPKYEVAECPDVYEVDGKLVLLVGFINKPEEEDFSSIRRDTRYYIGTFEDCKFKVESSGLLDYGRDYYAVQSFVTPDRIVSMGWNSDDIFTHVAQENSSNGSMGIPREMSIENNKLYAYPIKETETLRDKILYSGSQENFNLRHDDNVLCLELELSNKTGFNISLTHNSEEELTLYYDGNIFELKVYKNEIEENKTIIPVSGIRELTVLLDRSLVEVFINRGEYVATRRYYYEDPVHEIEASFDDANLVENAKVSSFKGIW